MKTRVFSAVLMIIVFIPFLLLGGIPFAIFMAFLSAYALHEVIKVRETRKKFPTVLKLFAYILVLVLCFTDLNTIEFQYNMDYRFLAFIVFLFTSLTFPTKPLCVMTAISTLIPSFSPLFMVMVLLVLVQANKLFLLPQQMEVKLLLKMVLISARDKCNASMLMVVR